MTPYCTDAAVTLYHGDCLDILPTLGMVDHVITDPPYSAETHGKTWRSKMMAKQGYQRRVSSAYDGLGFDAITDEEIAHFLGWCSGNCRRWFIAFSDLEGVYRWMMALRASGLDYVRGCVWDKVDGTPQLTGDRPAVGAEAIVCGHPPGRKHWNSGGKRGVYRHATNGRTIGAKPHPSTKPVGLMTELITDFTDEGETILDPFAGSGTTKYPYGVYLGTSAHRVVFRHFVGRIRKGYVVHHDKEKGCSGDGICVDWRHLKSVTKRRNLLLSPTVNATNAAKTHCANGHEFTPENTYRAVARGHKHRACRACKREWARRSRR